MATIFPFRALRYQASRVSPSQVVTQPYDKITPEMQDRYYAASPYNLVRIILGKREAADDANNNLYTRAATAYAQWRQQGVLASDPEPSIYAYSQRFTVPGAAAGAPQFERLGFIALGKIEDYADGVVFRHELTHSAPKTDRLNLLRATRAHFGQIFMLYSDPSRQLEALLASDREPDIAVRDEDCVLHRVWRIAEPQTIQAVRRAMAGRKLIIADGHHRYETALNYRNERRAQAGQLDEQAPYERVMMTFVNMDSEGLVILPTHRVLSGLPALEVHKFLAAAAPFFRSRQVSAPDAQRLMALLQDEGQNGTALVAATREGYFLLRSNPGAAKDLLADFSPPQQELDVVQLHQILLEHVLGISQEAIRNQQHITYLRDAGEALDRVRAGADVAFLMNPVRMQQLRDIAFAGGVMPQKSTDFYPKLLSGLTVYALE